MAPAEEPAEEEEEEEKQEGDEEEERDGPDKDGWCDLMGGTIRKRVISPGDGPEPVLKSDTICSYEVRLADSSSDEVLQRRTRVRYRIGESEAIPCLELGLKHMKQGEEADVFGAARMAWGPIGLPSAGEGERDVPADADVVLRVVLHECLEGETAEPTWNRKIQDITWRKENGNDHFRHKDYVKAVRCYDFGVKVFEGCFEPPEELANAKSASAMAMSLACDIGSNLAAAYLELGKPVAAREAATVALQWNPDHVKCLYRAARATFLLDEFEECEAAIQRVLGLEPENASVKRLEAEFKRKKQKYAEKQKRVMANMFAGLDGPKASSPAKKDAKAEAPREAGPADYRAQFLFGLSQAQLSYIVVGVLCCLVGGLIYLYLKPRHPEFRYLGLAVPCVIFPAVVALVASHSEEPGNAGAATDKKQK